MCNACFRILIAALALMIAVSNLSSTAQAALGEPVQAANIGWWWYYGQTPDQVASLLSTNNARLVSLRVQSSSPLMLDVAMVQNTGTFAKTWWWYYGLTAQQLADRATANDARIVNLEPYIVNGTTYFAAVMLHKCRRGLQWLVVVLRHHGRPDKASASGEQRSDTISWIGSGAASFRPPSRRQ